MKIIDRENVYTWKYTKTDIAKVQMRNGNIVPWEVISRTNNIPVVAALIENITDKTFVLVEQYRAPVDKRVVELVAGICDKPIPIEDIIKEEIIEETWYIAKNIEHIIKNSPKSPGIINEIANWYYAQVEWKRWRQKLWESEDIKVLEFPKQDIIKFLESKEKEGILVSSGIYSIIGRMMLNWINIMK